MAEVSLYTIQFIGNNPYGEYVSGDVVEVRIETTEIVFTGDPFIPSSAGIRTYKNGVQTFSGASMLDFGNTSYKLVTDITAVVCSGTSRANIGPIQFWPYALYSEIENANECAVDPVVCDLEIVGEVEVIRASGQTVSDGEITVHATSSNPIQYKLGSNFVYGDGSAQTSNVFTGLLPATYDIYIKDSQNCYRFLKVSVGIGFDYGTKYLHEFDDIDGNVCRIEIKQRGYTGEVTEICGSDNNFTIQLRAEGSDDKFEPVLAHNAVVSLISNVNFQYQELFTNDPERYRVHYLENGSLKSITKLLPNQFSEQYLSAPYYSTFDAHDGLPQLSELIFTQDDGQTFFGTNKVIKVISDILKKTKILLPIRVGVNLYADDMIEGVTDDPLDQAYCDYQAFYLFEKEPTFLSVLKNILTSFGAKIIQWDGRWNIIRCEEHVADFDYREFDSDGLYVSNGNVDHVTDLGYAGDNPDLIFIEGSQFMEMRPAYGTLKVVHPLGYKDNILVNGDFRLKLDFNSFTNSYTPKINTQGFTLVTPYYSLTEAYEQISETNVAYIIAAGSDIFDNPLEGGNAYIKSDFYNLKMGSNNELKIGIRCKVTRLQASFGGSVFTIEVPYVIVRMEIKYGPFYLDESGYWTFSACESRFYIDEFNTYKDFEILADPPKWKEYSVNLATTGNITLSGEQVIDGVLTSNSRVLVKNQTDGTENGIYTTSAGAWSSYATGDDVYYENAVAYVSAGTNNAGKTIIQIIRNRGLLDDSLWVNYTGDISLYNPFDTNFGGMPFQIRTYHAYAYYADFASVASLRAERTKSIGATPVIPTGARRTVRYDTTIDRIWFYELKEGTDADNGSSILRPDDYNGTTNARVWVRTNDTETGSVDGVNFFPFYIDKIFAQFLDGGKDPIDTVVRQAKGESNNVRVLEKKLALGSYSQLLSTYAFAGGLQLGYQLDSGLLNSTSFAFTSVTSNVLPAYLIYCAYLRDEDGNGYEFWHRDGIAESDKLHGIILKGLSAQYNKPWRLMRAVLKSMNGTKFGLLNVFREVNDNNRIYVPIGISLNVKNNTVSGEFLETVNIFEDPGSDGSGQAPYSSGFTTGFGASSFN